MIAAPPRQEARGLIERARRLRPWRSADVGGSRPRIGGLERRLAAVKAPWRDCRTPSSVGPGAKTTSWPKLRKRPALSQMARALSDDVRGRGI